VVLLSDFLLGEYPLVLLLVLLSAVLLMMFGRFVTRVILR
jgi:hypothetical protein